MSRGADQQKVIERRFWKYLNKGLCLNVGSGDAPMLGTSWENADANPDVMAEFHFDFRKQWPIRENKYDAVTAIHTLEHFTGDELFFVMWEIGRVLKPGGHLVAIVPHGLSETHYSNPFHKQAWTEGTPENFNRLRFEEEDTASTRGNQGQRMHAWKTVSIELVLTQEWLGKPEAEVSFAVKHYLNVVSEMGFVMRLEDK